MKRFWAILCSVTLLAVMVFAVLPVLSAKATGTFTDDMADLSKVSEVVGEWDAFANHAELGLSVAGRKTTAAENSLIYSFTGKTVEAVSIRVAEYTGFLASTDLTAAVKVGDSWTGITLTQSAESDITGKESLAFKWVTFTADSIPENATELKVTLNNGVAWTLLIDEISVELADAPAAEGTTFTDDMADLSKVSEVVGEWDAFANHAELGLSVAGRKTTAGENSLIYSFTGKTVEAVSIRVAEYTGFLASTDLTAAVKVGDSWAGITLTQSAESDIIGKESLAFKWVTFTADSIPENATELKVTLNNGVAWTLLIDEISVELADAPAAEGTTFTDDMADLSKVSEVVGEWDAFANHAELGLSVAGRKTTAAENSLIYSFAGKTVEAVSIRVAEYTGFLASTDLTAAVKVGDSWTGITLTQSAESDIIGKESLAFKWVTFTADSVPENATGLKVTLNNGVAWTLLIDEISVELADAEDDSVFVPENFTLTDPYDTLDVATSASDNLVLNTPHAETQLNVAGRKGTVGDSYLTYKKTGYRIGDFALTVQYAPEWTTLDTDLVISVRKANTNEWTTLTLIISDPTAIPTSSTDVFKSAVVTTTDILPEDAVELKVEMANSVIWTMFLDELNIDFVVSDLTDNPEQVQDGPSKPDIAFNFSELFESMDSIPEKSANWEIFTPHPETGLNAIGKTNNIKGTLTYKAEDGKVIDNFALKLQIAPAFFNPDAELLFQVRRAGSDDWETVALTVGYLQNINANFSTCWVQPEAALGNDVVEIRFGFYNSVAWTLMVNELHLNYALATADNPGGESSESPEISTDPETPDSPDTGVQAASFTILLTALSGAAVLFARKKKL